MVRATGFQPTRDVIGFLTGEGGKDTFSEDHEFISQGWDWSLKVSVAPSTVRTFWLA